MLSEIRLHIQAYVKHVGGPARKGKTEQLNEVRWEASRGLWYVDVERLEARSRARQPQKIQIANKWENVR
jgi:hypothetical protein